MAVINTVDDILTHPQPAAETTGSRVLEVVRLITIAASDDDGSKFLIAEVPDMAVLQSVTLESPAITGATDYDIGLFDKDGNVLNANVLADGLDMSSTTGLPTGSTGDPVRQGMTNLALTDATKRVFELAGHVNKAFPASGETNRLSKYRIGLTANTIGTAAATIIARTRYLMAV